MRRAVAVVFIALALCSSLPAARAGLLPDTPPIGTPVGTVDLAGPGLASANVEYIGTIPLDNPGVSGRVVDVGDQRRLYVSGIPGLSIYDITEPESPMLL